MRQTVSVILPTFNRSRFLPAAFAAIHAQQLTSWELIVIDDGSTDDTQAVVAGLSSRTPQPVRYLRQDNQGAYGARNTGLQAAQGEYIAFYDSDDLWLPHHLSTCVSALEAQPDVDWIYAACELVELETQKVIRPNSFYDRGEPRPFMRLAHDARGQVRVIASRDAIRCQIRYGLYCGLQNSVFRRRVFERLRFATDLRNEAEDQLFAIRAVAAGFRLAYIDDVHVRYQVHSENSSGAGMDASLEKRRRVFEPLIRGYERLATEMSLTAGEQRALTRRIGRDLFWNLGYAGYWVAGERRQALTIFARALRMWPWDLMQWKTYMLALARTSYGGEGHAADVPNRPV